MRAPVSLPLKTITPRGMNTAAYDIRTPATRSTFDLERVAGFLSCDLASFFFFSLFLQRPHRSLADNVVSAFA